MIKIKNIYVEDFEKILEKSIIIEYSNSIITIPGIIIFVKESESSNLINRIFNPSIEILSVDKETFEQMIEAISVYKIEGEKFTTVSKTKPVKNLIFNLKNLESQIVFAKAEDNTLIVNDFLFTSNESEFHGEAIFTSRKVFFLKKEDFAKIKNKLITED